MQRLKITSCKLTRMIYQIIYLLLYIDTKFIHYKELRPIYVIKNDRPLFLSVLTADPPVGHAYLRFGSRCTESIKQVDDQFFWGEIYKNAAHTRRSRPRWFNVQYVFVPLILC